MYSSIYQVIHITHNSLKPNTDRNPIANQLGQQSAAAGARNRHSFGGKGINDETLGAAAKQFGIGKFRHENQYHQMTSFIQLILCINNSMGEYSPFLPVFHHSEMNQYKAT